MGYERHRVENTANRENEIEQTHLGKTQHNTHYYMRAEMKMNSKEQHYRQGRLGLIRGLKVPDEK